MNCHLCSSSFEVSDEEKAFMSKMGLPTATSCPLCREAGRLAFRNERNLYKSTCAKTGKPIMCLYPPGSPFVVYEYSAWVSDNWTTPELEYNPDKNFFEQYAELQKICPRPNLFTVFNENCDYVNAAEKCKNCYLAFVSDRDEDCYYIDTTFASKDCADISYCHNCELCYESADLKNCYHARWSYLCENLSDVAFCFDCRGSKNCFMSSGLRNQEYVILNQPLSKQQYEQRMSELDLSSYRVVSALKEKFFKEIMPPMYNKMINAENSSGRFLINVKNCRDCVDVENAEDCYRVRIGANGIKDVHHTHAVVDGSQLIYNCVSVTESYNCHNVIGCWATKNSAYSEYLQGSSNCIGCISLRRREYCILNKQYSPSDYENIKADIIKKLGSHWGENFPISLAPFSYQDSAFRDYNSLSHERVEKMGWEWGEEKTSPSSPQAGSAMPDTSKDATPEITKQIFVCESSGKPYQIIPQELNLLKKIVAPLPRLHYDQRFRDRIRFRQTS